MYGDLRNKIATYVRDAGYAGRELTEIVRSEHLVSSAAESNVHLEEVVNLMLQDEIIKVKSFRSQADLIFLIDDYIGNI